MRQVSFGEMIACENEECPIEWFHLPCVGIDPAAKPEGDWYCKECTEKLTKEGKLGGASGGGGGGEAPRGGAEEAPPEDQREPISNIAGITVGAAAAIPGNCVREQLRQLQHMT